MAGGKSEVLRRKYELGIVSMCQCIAGRKRSR